MLALYLDDSTDRETSTGVIAGYIAHESMWPSFVHEWSTRLKQAGVSHFHATDFFNCRGEFKNWNPQSKKHLEFARRFTAIAVEQVTLGVSWGVNIPTFKEVVATNDSLRRATPNGRLTWEMWCSRWCLQLIAEKVGRPIHEPIRVVMESGDGTGGVIEFLRWLKKRQTPGLDCFVSFDPGGKKELMPLQAADLIAYESMRDCVERHIANPEKAPRKSLQRLLTGKRLVAEYQSPERLAETVKGLEASLLIPERAVWWHGHGKLREHKKHLEP